MILAENSYGDAKRLAYAERVLAARRPHSVLDVGCGSGDLLTAPLAKAHPDCHFLGVDSDAVSLAHAEARHRLPNLRFAPIGTLDPAQRFDLVIASEVLEHVEQPDQFLSDLRARLAPDGALLLTVPNGYGPAELGALIEALLQVSGLYRLLRAFWRLLGLKRAAGIESAEVNSLAVSPHINFFRHRALRDSLDGAGLGVADYRPRTFLCGFGFDHLVGLLRLIDWNARVADRLPPMLVSDWMFLAVPAPAHRAAVYRRGPYARFRRRLNRWRWGTA